MKLFISYRRSDTGGRAGRLFDLMVARFGTRNIFQDVAAIEPGADFARRVDDAISSSDAVLVVIGPEWLTTTGPDGTCRLDDPDDYVRREVGSALRSGARVVPVLVDEAELPGADDLPQDMRELASRQSVTLRDATWHQDADALVRRLEGGDVVDDGHRRRRLVAAGIAVVLVIAALAGWFLLRDDDQSDADDGALPECPAPGGGWTGIDMPEERSGATLYDGQQIEYGVRGADFAQEADGDWAIVLDVEFRNVTPIEDADPNVIPYFSAARLRTLLLNGLALGDPTCFGPTVGDQNVESEERVTALVGFESLEDPTGAALVLDAEDNALVDITDSA